MLVRSGGTAAAASERAQRGMCVRSGSRMDDAASSIEATQRIHFTLLAARGGSLRAASDALAARGASRDDIADFEAEYALQFPPMGRGGGTGKGRGRR